MHTAKQKLRSNKNARTAGRNPDRSKKRKSPDGSGPGAAPANDIQQFGFHFLAKELRPMPLMELALMQGHCLRNHYVGLIESVNTEHKMLQCIEDLHAIVKAQPKYKGLKEPEWKVDTPPVQVLQWHLRKLGPLAGGEEWTIDTFQQRGKTRYRFVVTKRYYSHHVGQREEYISLDFLPLLRKRDQRLHDMIVDLVALVSRCNKVPLWDEDGDFSKQLNILLAAGPSCVESLERQRVIYATGVARQYLTLIKARRKKVTTKSVQKMLHDYKTSSDRKRYVSYWIKKGIELAQTDRNISRNSFVPNYIPGDPIRAEQQYKFIWSHHKNDVLYARTLLAMRKQMKQGDYYPIMFSITNPGKVVQPLEHDDFPAFLYGFMQYGIKHFCWRHTDYYYGSKARNETLTPSEQLDGAVAEVKARTLLEIFELNGI